MIPDSKRLHWMKKDWVLTNKHELIIKWKDKIAQIQVGVTGLYLVQSEKIWPQPILNWKCAPGVHVSTVQERYWNSDEDSEECHNNIWK